MHKEATMASPRVLIKLLVVLCFAAIASGEPKEKRGDAEKATLIVHLANDGTDHGLRFDYPKAISASAGKSAKVPIVISNLLEEEVFLEVTDYDDLGYKLGDVGTSWAAGGGSVVGFPDNARLLKRLHASSYMKGKAFTCGCATAFISAHVAFDQDVSLKEFIGLDCRIKVTLKGYYRRNGNEFEKSVELPVEIVK
jgi:hypothetical protein